MIRQYFAGLLIVFLVYPGISVYGEEIEIPSSFNPVGSGARALGMGGAFIAVADDATAASWNPGGLIQLRKPECSIVASIFHRGEDISFAKYPEGAGSHSISEENINYFSATYPFELFEYNMVVSLSYQHLYDFTRDWQFIFRDEDNLPLLSTEENWNYQQEGSLTALGLSYCIRVIPQLSLGVTLNIWKDGLTSNKWEQKYQMRGSGRLGEELFTSGLDRIDSYSFSGVNANLGILWRVNKLAIGAVLKTPFKADVEHKIKKHQTMESPAMPLESEDDSDTRDEEIDMPMSYGIGFVYNFSDNYSISADIYRTEWDDFIYRNDQGEETSPVSGMKIYKSNAEPTHQIRIGTEYRFINVKKGYLIPVRCGIFYDPAPAEGSPDDFYGFSLGAGFTESDRFSLDIAYQYRAGNDIGASLFVSETGNLGFSQDVDEHMVYISMILYNF